MVPYNYRGLFDAMGGNAAVLPRLDAFFTDLNAGPAKANAYLGNEPTLETAVGLRLRGCAVQDGRRGAPRADDGLQAAPNGYVGNDDLGEMSSWAVWARSACTRRRPAARSWSLPARSSRRSRSPGQRQDDQT